ncbi:MAG: thiolase family protein [Betaproteobacteria bacterium]|nr:thiolase family protein [Betaproteobacteria bacterium]
MEKVAIVGVGTLPWKSRYQDRTARALAFDATRKALADAGLAKSDIDGMVYSIYCDTMLMQQHPGMMVQDYLGLGGRPSLRVTGGAATGGYNLYAAFTQVASGLADVLLLVAVQKGQDFYSFATGSRGDGLQKGFAISFDTMWLTELIAGVPAFHTLRFRQPHFNQYGGPTREQVAAFSSMCHHNGAQNPESQLRVEVTPEEVMNSRIVAWPTTMLECCLYSDCACALILASEKRAREICDKPVWISGISVSSHPSGKLLPDTVGRLIGVNVAAQRAYDMAGVRNPASELDLLEINDLTSATGLISLEELGLCELGQSGPLAEDGSLAKEGKHPVNPSGGRVGCGHVAGVSAIYSAAQVTKQLQERAGPTQVRIRSGRGLVESIDGYGGLAGVAVLER